MIPLGVLASGYVAAGGGAGGFSFVSHTSTPAFGNTHSLTLDIGSPAPDRVVIFAISAQNGISGSAAINGQTPVQDAWSTGLGSTVGGTYRAAVATGTTCVLTFSTSQPGSRVGVGVWRASGGTLDLVTTATGNAADLTVAAGDLVVTAKYANAETTWTGVPGAYDAVYALPQQTADRYTGAYVIAESAGTVSPRAAGGIGGLAQLSTVYRLT